MSETEGGAATPPASSPAAPEKPYRFDPAKTRIIVLTWPDAAVTVEAMRWIWTHWKDHPQNAISHCQKAPVDVVRCKAVEMYCLPAPREIEQFIFMDRDMRPGQDSNPVLVTPGDVAACQYPTPRLCDWSDPRALHMGLVRFSRKVVETLAAEKDSNGNPIPIFFFRRSPTNSNLVSCECSWFAGRVTKAGFKIARAGTSGHGK